MRKKQNREKTINVKRFLSSFLLLVFVSAFLSGCDIYNADIPEFTTGSERDNSFRAVTFEEQHSAPNPEKERLEKMVDEKLPQIMEQGKSYKEEVENFQDEVTDGLNKLN